MDGAFHARALAAQRRRASKRGPVGGSFDRAQHHWAEEVLNALPCMILLQTIFLIGIGNVTGITKSGIPKARRYSPQSFALIMLKSFCSDPGLLRLSRG